MVIEDLRGSSSVQALLIIPPNKIVLSNQVSFHKLQGSTSEMPRWKSGRVRYSSSRFELVLRFGPCNCRSQLQLHVHVRVCLLYGRAAAVEDALCGCQNLGDSGRDVHSCFPRNLNSMFHVSVNNPSHFVIAIARPRTRESEF